MSFGMEHWYPNLDFFRPGGGLILDLALLHHQPGTADRSCSGCDRDERGCLKDPHHHERRAMVGGFVPTPTTIHAAEFKGASSRLAQAGMKAHRHREMEFMARMVQSMCRTRISSVETRRCKPGRRHADPWCRHALWPPEHDGWWRQRTGQLSLCRTVRHGGRHSGRSPTPLQRRMARHVIEVMTGIRRLARRGAGWSVPVANVRRIGAQKKPLVCRLRHHRISGPA